MGIVVLFYGEILFYGFPVGSGYSGFFEVSGFAVLDMPKGFFEVFIFVFFKDCSLNFRLLTNNFLWCSWGFE